MATVEVCPRVNLDGRRFAVTRSLTPLCIGKIETPDRNALLAADGACANNAGPAVVTPSIVLSIEHGVQSRHGRLELLDDIGHHRKHRATILCAGFEDVAECLLLNLLIAFPEGDANVPRNTALTKPIGLALAIFPWQVFHGPVLDQQY